MDSIPHVIITGQVPTHAIGQDAFQECDTVGITRPVRQAQLPGEGREGHRAHHEEGVLHRGDRPPGPGGRGHPEGRDRAQGRVRLSRRRSRCAPTTRSSRATRARSRRRSRRSCRRKRPMIYTGGGVVLGGAAEELTRLVRLLGFPCTNTLMGLGALSRDRPPVPRHARHARHLRSEHGDAALRRAARDRRALRRPRDRQSRSISSQSRARSSTSTSIRRRSRSACRVDVPIVGNVREVLKDLIRQLEAGAGAGPTRRR